MWRNRYVPQTKRFLQHLSVDRLIINAYHTALCTANDATNANTEAVQTLCAIKFIDIIAGKMAVIAKINENDDGERY